MSTLISNYLGRPWEDRTPTAGFEDQNDIHFTKGRFEWSGVEESNLYNDFRRIMSYPLNERQLYVLYFVLCVYVNGALT